MSRWLIAAVVFVVLTQCSGGKRAGVVHRCSVWGVSNDGMSTITQERIHAFLNSLQSDATQGGDRGHVTGKMVEALEIHYWEMER